MKLREIFIKNFRNLVDLCIPVDDTTVLVGENNSGKTALLDALRIALPATGYGRTNPFSQYDYHMSRPGDSPENSNGIVVELWFREDKSGEWPDSILRALSEIIQTDPVRDINSVGIRLSSRFDEAAGQFVFTREILNLQGEALTGKSQSPAMVTRFLEYVRLFYLSALRDSDVEFSPRSQFWGRILRDLKIGESDRKTLSEELSRLNESLMKADSRLDEVRRSLERIQKVVAAGDAASIQPLPMQPWDLMAKSQVFIRARGTDIDLPLSRHGQGIQSLAVLFVFQAYVNILLKPTFHKETMALLALEEPEAHLHPQAIRSLGRAIEVADTQKIISTHSPYVLQGLPITSIRLFRRIGGKAQISYVRRWYEARVPATEGLIDFCKKSNGKYDFHEGNSTLTVRGKVDEQEYRKILPKYAQNKEAQSALKALKEESQGFITDQEIDDLDTYAKRIRGEIFFARAWLLCEGQSEFLLLHYFAELLGTPLDEHGVTVIDFQNNGSPGAFIALARNLDIPWILLCDNDGEGKNFVISAKKLLPSQQIADELLRPLPAEDNDLELFLVSNGFVEEFEQILVEKSIAFREERGQPEFLVAVAEQLRKHKIECATELIRKLRESGASGDRVPPFFAKAVQDIVAKAG
jgi:putative ATP-dependent endonuclease of OLD family